MTADVIERLTLIGLFESGCLDAQDRSPDSPPEILSHEFQTAKASLQNEHTVSF